MENADEQSNKYYQQVINELKKQEIEDQKKQIKKNFRFASIKTQIEKFFEKQVKFNYNNLMNSDDVLKKIQDIEQLAEEIQNMQFQNKQQGIKKKLQTLRDQIIECCIYISEGTENSEYGISVEVVQLLLLLNDKYKFEQHFEFCEEIPIIFHFIKAFYSQNFWKLKELSQELSEIEDYCKSLFPIDKKNLFTLRDSDFPNELNYYGRKNFNMIGYALVYGETLMQHTAVLSQLSQHDKALDKVQECFDFIKRVFQSLRETMKLMVQIGTQNLSIFDFKNKQSFDNFFRYVSFVSEIELPNYKAFKDDFVFVGVNTQANDSELFKKLVNDKKGEFLGKKLNEQWVLDLHISNIVKLSKVQELIDKIDCNVFAEEILIKLIFVMGCCIFSMAAENRFLSHSEISKSNIETQEQQKQTNQPKKLLQNYSKELNLLKHPRFSFSEQIHKKAIEILYFGIDENSKLLNHFLQSFKKNYNLNMFMIQEVEEPSVTTVKNSEYFSNNIIQQSINGMIKNELNNLIKQKDLDKITKLKKQIKEKFRKKSKSPLQKLSLNYRHKKLHFPPNQAFMKKSKTITQEDKDNKQKKIENLRAKQFLNKIKKEQEVEKLKKFSMTKNTSKKALLELAKSPVNNSSRNQEGQKKKRINSQLISKSSKDLIANVMINKSAQNNSIQQSLNQNDFSIQKDKNDSNQNLQLIPINKQWKIKYHLYKPMPVQMMKIGLIDQKKNILHQQSMSKLIKKKIMIGLKYNLIKQVKNGMENVGQFMK